MQVWTICVARTGSIVNVEIHVLYIFLCNFAFLNIDIRKTVYRTKEIYNGTQTSFPRNANFNSLKIVHFHKFAKMYVREDIYVHSMFN